MPEFFQDPERPLSEDEDAGEEVQFPPVTREHILYCSYDYWFPKYRQLCLRSRIIPLSPEFVEYLREDGITLTDDGNDDDDDDDDWEPSNPQMRHFPSADEIAQSRGYGSDEDDEDDDNPPATVRLAPNKRFPEIHQQIKDSIAALGGIVAPKLNWSAPKDATWLMEEKNTMRCRTPDDIYLLLKSSNFISHDLEHTFDGCAGQDNASNSAGNGTGNGISKSNAPGLGFQPVLVLRAHVDMHTALEFRCFVKHRNLVAITPRDLKYYPFLEGMRSTIIERAKTLFHSKLQFSFPSGHFAFDIYIPEKKSFEVGDDEDQHDSSPRLSRARLIDINPWAPRTDTLLFTWPELLTLKIPKPFLGMAGDDGSEAAEASNDPGTDVENVHGDNESEDDEDDEDEDYEPELRLVEEANEAAFNFCSAPYSAHKLPKEVVDASMAGEGGLREFAQQWQEIVQHRERA